MRAQLLTIAATASLMFATAQGLPASDLGFAFTSLSSAARTSAVASRPQAREASPSKLLLGAFLTDVNGQLQVTGTVPGSAASRVLKPGDILEAMICVGQPSQAVSTRNQFDLALQNLGSDRQAVLEINRPGTGTQQVQVTFHTPDELTRFSADARTGRSMVSR